MPFTRIATFAGMLFALLGFSAPSSAETVRLYFDPATPQIAFAAGDIKAALEMQSYTVQTNNLSALTNDGSGKRIILALATDTIALSNLIAQGGAPVPSLGTQAYALRTTTTNSHLSFWVVGGDAVGAMYGGLQIAENISFNGFSGSYINEEKPFLLNRGMKLNLPLDKRIPTYVGGWSSYSAREAIPHVWDMTFWKTLIDQQARSRYNLLSVWVHHPFPALVKVPAYSNACLPNIQKYDGTIIDLNHTQRVAFWREVMQYAHDRGMKFYFFNWNVYVDYASTQYPALTRDQTNTTTIDYYYKSMQALLATYPELDGFGISGGDGMVGGTPERTQWTWDAMGKAVYDYLTNNPSRQFNLIHRRLGATPTDLNTVYAPLRSVTNATLDMSQKYAQAHMYSTPTPTWSSWDIESCYNLGFKTWLTLRNDDYFYLNWGDPKFIRDFMTGIPRKDTTVIGMYIGSDGYNPTRARLFATNYASLNGQLEVERRWYMEMLWGRLSYNTNTSDVLLQNLLARRYAVASASSTNLFNAWSLASRSLPKVTELIMKDWDLDYHWYPEGCWSDPGRCGGFRTISDATGDFGGFAGQDVASGSALCNISNSAAGNCGGKKSSYQLADEMQVDAQNALDLINPLSGGGNADLEVALNNVKQMAYLSRYYAHKIRGATYKKAGQTLLAREEMGQAYCWWISYSRSMGNTYLPDSFRNLAIAPDWKYADAAVLKEYTDLGGVGIPDCDNYFTLTTSATNGSVSLNPSGGIYETNSVVTVTANPNFGYAFGNWSVDLSGSVSPTNLTMNGHKSVTANFVVSTNGDMSPWIETFPMGDGAKSDGAPTSWIATRSTGKFEVASNRLMVNGAGVMAVFETAEINIPGGSVKVSLDVQSGGGIDSGDYVRLYKIVDGGPPVQIGSTITGGFVGTLAATNITGSKLKLRIETAVSATDEFYYLDNLKVEYEVPPVMFTLTTSATNGVVTPLSGSYASNSTVQLTATANLGYAFSSWSGDLTGSLNPTNLTINGNKSVAANFVPVPTYTLTTNGVNGSITLSPPPIGGFYSAGTVVTVTAVPNSGYSFGSWGGDLTGSTNPTTITMNGNKSVTANFTSVPTYTITATAGMNGAITPSNSVVVSQNANQTFTMLPNSGYEVDVVTVDGASQGSINSYTFTNVITNHTISVTFKVSVGGVGLLGSWVQGTTHAREAGNNRALVVMLYGEGSGNISASSVTYGGQAMTKVSEVAYQSGSYSYSGAFVLNDAGVVAAAPSGTIAVTWSTAPSSGSDITSAFYSGVNQSSLTGASASNGLAGLTITTTALANNAGDMVLVGGTAGTGGTYTINNGFTRGIPETTASFGDITSAYKLGTGTSETPSLTMSGSMRQTIVAFVLKKSGAAPVQYTLTTNAVNGTITLNPTGGVYTGGTVVMVTANPNSGYTFSGWSGDLSGSVSPTNITMNANKSVTANFSVQLISILPPILQGGQLRLEWVGGGTLQTATNVTGPWSDILGAVSPYLNPTTNAARFFRVKQ